MTQLNISWINSTALTSRSFICGYCGNSIASNMGYGAQPPYPNLPAPISFIYICHYCNSPTFFAPNGKQTPGALFGKLVNDIPSKDVEELYNEARRCVGVGSYTASVLCCRKLLMNIAVSKDAPVGLNFIDYIDFLSKQGFIPPDGKDWVDHVRKKGNEATHEIALMKQDDAEELISFIEMLLKFIYEFPAIIKKKSILVP